jgi:hypothetical protein
MMEKTDWNAYGRASGNPKCQDCMVHCGYEPAAVEATFGSLRGLLGTARLMLLGPPRARPAGDVAVAPLPSPARHVQPNGLPSLPILDHVA